jgi:hypothetical protein
MWMACVTETLHADTLDTAILVLPNSLEDHAPYGRAVQGRNMFPKVYCVHLPDVYLPDVYPR